MKRLAFLTSGGDAPGMNAAIRSIIRSACSRGIEPWGGFRGYEGLLAGDLIRLGWRNAGGIVHHGGTVLKTARCPAFREKEAQARAADILHSRGMDGLIVIGGDGSMAGAAALQELGIATAVVPATIDNDMCGTEETIGYDTAVNTVLESVSRIRDTAASHDRAAVVEVMGRHAGHIALAAGLAGGAEFTLVPEVPFSREAIAASLMAMQKEGRTNSIIICAEGAADGQELAAWLREKTGIDVCATILGYIQRGGPPTARDALLGAILGAAAVDGLAEGRSGFLAGCVNSRTRLISYEEAFRETRTLYTADYDLALRIGAGCCIRP